MKTMSACIFILTLSAGALTTYSLASAAMVIVGLISLAKVRGVLG